MKIGVSIEGPDETGGYVVSTLGKCGLDICTQGDSIEDALYMIKDAVLLTLAAETLDFAESNDGVMRVLEKHDELAEMYGHHIEISTDEVLKYAYELKEKQEEENVEILIKYFTNESNLINTPMEQKPLEKITKGDWIDLHANETVELQKGEFALIPLGVAMKLPDGYEAHLAPRSSTFKNFHILQANGVGVIDNSYCGDNDQWFFPAFATEYTVIHKDDKIAQFRIMKKQPNIKFIKVDKLKDTDRGGFGTTGKQ